MNAPPPVLVANLDIDVLRSFVAISETGSFTRAAERVFRSPSAISMQIKKLEETIGRSVFERDSRSISITPDGELLLGYARRMLDLNREAVARFRAPEVEGVVRIGAPDDFAEHTLPDILRRFAEIYPRVSVSVVMDGSHALRSGIESGRLDAAFINCMPGQELAPDARLVMEVPLVWAGLMGGTAHGRDPLPVAMWNQGCVWHQMAVASLESVNRTYRVAYMSGHTSGQRAAILADLAVSPYPASLIHTPLVRLGKAEGMPDIGAFKLAAFLSDDAGEAAKALVDEVMTCCR